MELLIREYPLIEDDKNHFYYGGSQKWFTDPWARQAGCASVSAAALAAYYAIGVEKKRIYSKEVYVSLMRKMYACMTPGIHGYPDPYKYRDALVSYAKRNGASIHGIVKAQWTDLQEPLHFIQESMCNQSPVSLLVLKHSWKDFYENTWHWMSIMGMDEEKEGIIIANYGHKESWNWNYLLEPSEKNQVALVRIDQAV